ncbi:MAG TPA: APC family permease [Terriglobales bacterium]|nr:APC family permease [Terriglobales bacterium]
MSDTAGASSNPGTPFASAQGRLLKVLGVWFGIAAAIGNTIAAGIVRTPGDIAGLLPNAWLFLFVWVLGGAYALLGASALAELGAAIPRSGGQYNYSQRALGDYGGFIVGWSDWLSTCGTNAAVAIVIGEYSTAFVPSLDAHERFFLIKIIAVTILLLFAVLQWRGVKWGSGTQLVTAALKTGAFVILVIACFLLGGHLRAAAAAAHPAPPLGSGWPLLIAFLVGLQSVIYTVDGWDGVIYFGEEVKDPGRDVPRAIFGSVFSIMAIYLLLNAAVLYVLPIGEISGNIFALGTAANRIFGWLGDPIIRIIMIVSLLSCINACQMFSTRVLYAMSCDRLFFRRAARVNAGGTPVLALLLSTFVGIVFVLGSFERVIAMLSFFFVANYTLSYTSLFVLRKREPDMPRPYRAWGYPWTAGIALAASAVFLVASLWADRSNAPLAFGLLVISYPVFLILRWVSRRVPANPS